MENKMIKKILITLLTLCIVSNTYAKKKDKVKTIDIAIKVTNIFTCYDLDKLTLTNGTDIYCREDTITGEKSNYDRELAITQINSCLSRKYNNVAILTLLGEVICVEDNDKETNK